MIAGHEAPTSRNDEGPKRRWTDYSPQDAKDLELPHPDVQGPVNEMGEPCPWPWEPQTLVGAPMGQYHCPYCGAMVLAGVAHPDYGEGPDEPAGRQGQES